MSNETGNPQEPADDAMRKIKLALDIENQRLLNVKLKQDVSPFGRLVSLAAPTISILTAVAAIIISVWTQHNQNVYQNRSDQQKSLATALESVAAQASVSRQLSGVYQLTSLWHVTEDEEIVAATLTAILSTDGDANRELRCAAADGIGQAINDADLRATDVDRTRRVTRMLFGYGDDGMWGLVAHQNFVLHHANSSAPEGSLGTYACGSPLDATKEAIRRSWRYLQHVNLQETDLRRTPFYEADLSKAMMKGALLDGASFRCANLFRADLRSIHIDPSTDLRLVNVKGAVSGDFVRDFAKVQHIVVIDLDDDQWHEWSSSGFSGRKLLDLTHGTPSEPEILASVGGKVENVKLLCQNGVI
jgi:uncharacterized protein YjbI with pentapeptide repeats